MGPHTVIDEQPVTLLMLTRFGNWQSRLSSFLAETAYRRFAYGAWDCCLFPCDAIRVMTGVDPALELRGQYHSRRDAYRLIRSVQEVAEKITSQLQMPEVPVLLARRGDVVRVQRPRDSSLGLVALNGREIIVCRREGLCRISLAHAVQAWRV